MATNKNNMFALSGLAMSMGLLVACSEPAQPVSEQAQVSETSSMQQQNPFFTDYTTQFEIPPFSDIQNQDYKPAMMAGMKAHLLEIDAIVNNVDEASFDNTIVALERTGKLLTKVQRVFYNMTGANTDSELQALQREFGPLISGHYDKISLNGDLFKRVDAVWQQRESLELTGEERMLLKDTYLSFVRSGAKLTQQDKEQLKVINAELSKLGTAYGQNLLAETNGFELILSDSDLDGLSAGVKAAAAEKAADKMVTASEQNKSMYKDKYVFTPHRSSMYPFLTESTRRDLRQQLYTAYVERGNKNNENNNITLAASLATLRAKRANILGYDTHADYVLEQRMVKTPAQVYDLLLKLWKPSVARAKDEVASMQAIIDKEGHDFTFAAWDWWHYAEKVRKEKYDLDEAQIKPYLSLDNVLDGAFDVANKLWGLSFKELYDTPVYHPDVRAWQVIDKDGSHLGVFMGDYFTRSNKRGGAWMSSFKGQSNLDGRQRPVVVNVCNFPAPVGDTPSLLSFDQVNTLFHEFGHALHGLVTNTRFGSLSGTSGPRDFTEFPAQIFEHWANEPQVLKAFATHYETGEAMPDTLIAKLQAASKFNQGFANTEYLAASLLDMNWHTVTADQEISDPAAFERDAMKEIGLIAEIAPRYRSTYFSHIFAGGYAAGYYSYVHSAVLDSDGYEAFKETGDIFDQTLAQKYRTHVLEKGGTEEAMSLYKQFRGREPKIDALLKARGLDGSE